jgi:hypothetical protein
VSTSLLLQITLLLGVVHLPSLLPLVFLRLVFSDGNVKHIHPLLTVLHRVGKELEDSVDHYQVKPELFVHLLEGRGGKEGRRRIEEERRGRGERVGEYRKEKDRGGEEGRGRKSRGM